MRMNTQELIVPNIMDGRSHHHDRTEVLHWDGRLDNRDDLLLRLRDSLQGDTGNAAIARATYERWGTGGFVHPNGAWGMVIFDRGKPTTGLARDFSGARPPSYHVPTGRALWASPVPPPC